MTTIGLEVHIALSTNRKAFSPGPNTESSWISLGFPGTLPSLNTHAIEQTIRLSYSLNCFVNYSNITFDRKNYFHYDLPRGYQITQYFNPLGVNGYLILPSGKKIRIKQVHLEEDTAQQFKRKDKIQFNFSRLGQALAEVVTEPDFENYEEVYEFLRLLRRICSFNHISTVLYEKGEIRVDLNVSIRNNVEEPLGKKSEVKNLNSCMSIKKSIDYLINKFNEDSTKFQESTTYTWSEQTQICVEIRKKNSFFDYFYIPETNIPPIFLEDSKYQNLIKSLLNNFNNLEHDLKSSGLKDLEITYLLDNYSVFEKVMHLNKKLNNLPSSYNWIVNIVSGIYEHPNWDLIPYLEIEKVILKTEIEKILSLKISKAILKEMFAKGITFEQAYDQLNISLISDDVAITQIVERIFCKFQDSLSDLAKNPQKLEKLIIGQCMKESKGQADPKIVKSVFDSMLPRFIKG